MQRLRLVLPLVLLTLLAASKAHADDACTCDATPAACDAGCACDLECAVDWSLDECADPAAGCVPGGDVPDEAALEAQEAAAPADVDPVDWATAPADVACADGATNQQGRCIATDLPAPVAGGCAATTPGLVVGAAVLVLLAVARRRRRALVALAIVACTVGDASWDDAVDGGPTGDARHVDVYAAELAGGAAQYLLASQPLAAGAEQPAAQFSLSRAHDATAIFRVASTCGDRLATAQDDGAELLGWARAQPGDGTAALVELAAPDACTFVYETDPDAITDLVAQGYERLATLGYVWPPGLADAPLADAPDVTTLAAPAPCTITRHSALQLLYASPGEPYAERFLLGCPGEVVMGDKSETGPRSSMRTAAAHAAGGRTAFVLDRNGNKLRALLQRPNGFERTVAYLKHKLALGYDYVVLDEVTSAADYADGQWLNRAVRALLVRLPERSFIPYISIDLTQELSPIYMKDRRLLLRAFRNRARVMALEVYLHTDQVMAGQAPATFRRAADRLQNAVAGLRRASGMNAHAITTIGATHRSTYAQYRYLDHASHDLASITRQVNALRHASRRTRQQHGVGWYFVDSSDLAPVSTYSFDALIRRMRTQALRFE
ncbi:MAG: hypothetical protein ACM31C_00970 [Acidobacteriota bacterium]